MTVRKRKFKPRVFWHPESDCLIDARTWSELWRLQDNIELSDVTDDQVAINEILRGLGGPPIMVVNLHYQECDIRIDRGGPFGNPYHLGKDGDRKQVLKKFSDWVSTKPLLVADLRQRVWRQSRKWPVVRLGCWCAPELCHGNVYVSKLDKM